MDEEKIGMLVPLETYLEAGVHIGTKVKTADSKKFILKRRKDGIYIMDIRKIDEGIRKVLNELKKYDLKNIAVVTTRVYAANAAKKMQRLLGDIKIIEKRFIPGTFTNPESKHFIEPEVVLICDPRSEKQAIIEAKKQKIRTVGLLDTDNVADGLDVYTPINNKGRRSLALFFWLLTRELMLKEGRIKNYSEFKYPQSYFEKLEEIE